jgi:hypothetical protein
VSDQERILKLLADGKITKEQAEKLLEALESAEKVEANDEVITLNGKSYQKLVPTYVTRDIAEVVPKTVDKVVEELLKTPLVQNAFLPVVELKPLEFSFEAKEFKHALLESQQWVRVISSAGDVRVRVDPTLVTPIANGENGPLPITTPHGQDKPTVNALSEDLELILPMGYGVMLDVKSGDVDIEECFAIGQVLSGDVRLDSVSGVILTVMSGDVAASLLITEGQHAIKVMSGDADIRLLSGSSVQVQAVVRSGTITSNRKNASAGYVSNKRFNTTVGKPQKTGAHLDLSAMSGDLNLEVDDE